MNVGLAHARSVHSPERDTVVDPPGPLIAPVGIRPGLAVGEVLDEVLPKVLDGP